jgi:hypothetical protein
VTKVLWVAAFLLAIVVLVVIAALQRKPRIERSQALWKAFEAPEKAEAPFVAWLMEKGFGAVDGGYRGPSGTRRPMTVRIAKAGGRIRVDAAWVFEGPESEEEDDEARGLAFIQTLISWWDKRKTP